MSEERHVPDSLARLYDAVLNGEYEPLSLAEPCLDVVPNFRPSKLWSSWVEETPGGFIHTIIMPQADADVLGLGD